VGIVRAGLWLIVTGNHSGLGLCLLDIIGSQSFVIRSPWLSLVVVLACRLCSLFILFYFLSLHFPFLNGSLSQP